MSASPAASTIARVINKTKRRKKGKDSANNSIASNDSDDGEGRRGLRTSLDSAIEKIKTLKPDEDNAQRGKRLSNLIPGRKKNDAQVDEANRQSMDEASRRGRSISEKRTVESDLSALHSTTGDRPEAERNRSRGSLITVDSDLEA